MFKFIIMFKPSMISQLSTWKYASLAVLCLAAIVERGDEQLLPSMFAWVARSLETSPSHLGLLTFARALAQALASPLAGAIGQCVHRGRVIAFGCILWTACAAAFALISSLKQGAPVWALGGVGLAFIVPNVQSLVADGFEAGQRGKAFGAVHLASTLGGMVGAYGATMAASHKWSSNVDGWRLVFCIAAICSAISGVLNFIFAHEPRDEGQQFNRRHFSWRTALKEVKCSAQSAIRIPTFVLLVLQGVLGSMPWAALVWLTLYLQLIGMSAKESAVLVCIFFSGIALGGFIGGFVGDELETRFPGHGRVCAAQFSVGIGIPFSLLLFKGLPRDAEVTTVYLYGTVLFVFAVLKAWPAPACNNPIFAEIIDARQRPMLYALDRCLETALAAFVAPTVGFLAERMGFSGTASPTGWRSIDLANAHDLGNAILVFLIVPWSIVLFLYTGLHWTYAKDKRKVCEQQAASMEQDGTAWTEEIPLTTGTAGFS